MPTEKPAVKKPIKKKSPAKKSPVKKAEAPVVEDVAVPSTEVAENQAEAAVELLDSEGPIEGLVEAPDAGEPVESMSKEAPVQIVTLVSLSLKTGGNVQFDIPAYIPTAREVHSRIEELLPSQVFILNPEENILLLKVDHMSEEEFRSRLNESQQPQA